MTRDCTGLVLPLMNTRTSHPQSIFLSSNLQTTNHTLRSKNKNKKRRRKQRKRKRSSNKKVGLISWMGLINSQLATLRNNRSLRKGLEISGKEIIKDMGKKSQKFLTVLALNLTSISQENQKFQQLSHQKLQILMIFLDSDLKLNSKNLLLNKSLLNHLEWKEA